jgi:glycosyltransferase involved in cell wall biosynthesis
MLTPKKILFITHLYYPAIGGAERVFQRLAEGLAHLGHAVTVLTSDALSTEQYFTAVRNSLQHDEVVNGVRVLRGPVYAPVYRAFKVFDKAARRTGNLGVFFRPFVFGPHFIRPFLETLQERFGTVIAGPVPTTAVFHGLLYKMKHRSTQLVIFPHMHTNDRLHTTPLNLWAIRKADAVYALTEAEKKYLIRRRVKAGRIIRVVNGVDEDILRTPVSKPAVNGLSAYVLYLGQEGSHKRIPLLIRAMIRVWEKGYSTPLVIAGARTNFSPVLDKIIKVLPSRYRERIHRFNDIPELQKISLLDDCRVMVNPSSYEAFGIVFLEAWARRKAVIGARIASLKEIIRDGEDGFLFEDKNAADLEEKILRIVNDVSLASRMGAAGRCKVEEKYVWPKIVAQVETSLGLV